MQIMESQEKEKYLCSNRWKHSARLRHSAPSLGEKSELISQVHQNKFIKFSRRRPGLWLTLHFLWLASDSAALRLTHSWWPLSNTNLPRYISRIILHSPLYNFWLCTFPFLSLWKISSESQLIEIREKLIPKLTSMQTHGFQCMQNACNRSSPLWRGRRRRRVWARGLLCSETYVYRSLCFHTWLSLDYTQRCLSEVIEILQSSPTRTFCRRKNSEARRTLGS